MLYVTVIIAQRLPYNLTYGVPTEMESRLSIGLRVEIPIGRSAVRSAIVTQILSGDDAEQFQCDMKRGGKKIRDIISIIDTSPIVSQVQVTLLRWISSYYMVSEGEVLRYFLPQDLIVKGRVDGGDTTYGKSRSRREVRYLSAGAIEGKRSALAKYFLLQGDKELTRDFLLSEGFSAAQISLAVRSGVLTESRREEYIEINRGVSSESSSIEGRIGVPYQQEVSLYGDKPLLITTSRRFELIDNYIEIAKSVVSGGGQLLILSMEGDFPSAQFTALFGDCCVVYSSNISASKRYDIYCRVVSGEPLVIIGGKLSLGLPFSDLRGVIVSEEHSATLRSDSSPRINCRDVAVMLGGISGARVLLDSTVPTIESCYNVIIGKYDSFSLPQEVNRAKVSLIEKYSIAAKERKAYGNIPKVRYLSKLLISEMESYDSTFLFHNRRGYNRTLQCDDCGWVLKCEHCSVPMTYHHSKGVFICHYCNSKRAMIDSCGSCGSKSIQIKGIGSENIEERVKAHFPLTPIYRMDSDVLSNKKEFRSMMKSMLQSERRVVIGTVMSLPLIGDMSFDTVGVIDADTLLSIDDFRAEERAYRLLTHLISLAKRRVVIQCRDISAPLFRSIEVGDYHSVVERELETRRVFGYPPFVRITRITVKHRSENTAQNIGNEVYSELKGLFDMDISEPIVPYIDKVRDEYITVINIKFRRGDSVGAIKRAIMNTITRHSTRGVKISCEVDI